MAGARRELGSEELRAAGALALRIAASRGCGHEDAEDISQTALERLVAQDQPPSNVEAWVTTVTKNLVADLYRRRLGARSADGERRPVSHEPLDGADQHPEAFAMFIRSAVPASMEGMMATSHEQLQAQLASVLSPREMQIAALRAEGCSLAQIAEQLGYANAASVKSTLGRMRRKLAQLTPELLEFRQHPRPY